MFCVAAACCSSAAASSLRKPQAMDDVIGDNYFVKYNMKTDALELMKGTHPEKAAKVAETQTKRAAEEKEKNARSLKVADTKAHEEATKAFWGKKLEAMKALVKTATADSKKAAFSLADKVKIMNAREAAREHEVKELEKDLAKAEEALEMATDVRKKASGEKANADTAYNSNTNANQQGALKGKRDAAHNDFLKCKVVVDAAEDEVKKATAALKEAKAKAGVAEAKDKAELGIEQASDKTVMDTTAKEMATEKQVRGGGRRERGRWGGVGGGGDREMAAEIWEIGAG